MMRRGRTPSTWCAPARAAPSCRSPHGRRTSPSERRLTPVSLRCGRSGSRPSPGRRPGSRSSTRRTSRRRFPKPIACRAGCSSCPIHRRPAERPGSAAPCFRRRCPRLRARGRCPTWATSLTRRGQARCPRHGPHRDDRAPSHPGIRAALRSTRRSSRPCPARAMSRKA